MSARFLYAVILGIFLSWLIGPSKTTIGSMRWGRRLAAFGVLIATVSQFWKIFSNEPQGGINAFAVWLLHSVVLGVVGLLIGLVAYNILGGAKKLANLARPECPPDARDTNPLQVVAGGQAAPASSARDPAIPKNKSVVAVGAVLKGLPAVAHPMRTDIELDPALNDAIDDEIYGQISREIESKQTDKALWTKAFAVSGGDDKQTHVIYIKLRYERLFPTHYVKAVEIQRVANAQKKKEDAHKFATEQDCNMQSSLKEKFELGLLNGELERMASNGDGVRFLIACRRMALEAVQLFVNRDVMFLVVTDSDGNSGLHIAIKEKREDIAKYLTASGAPVLLKNKAGKTPLELARAMFPRISNSTALMEKHARLPP